MTRAKPSPLLAALVASGFAGAAATLACNALVGNGDIEIADASTDAPSLDSLPGVGPDSGENARGDAGSDEGGQAGQTSGTCEAGTKSCQGLCVGLDDSAYGCGPARCNPCELPNAFAGCAATDGGPDGAAFACSVAACKPNRADCNGSPLDGCEVDTSSDLYNCGRCGHDCSSLPNVAGNVSCVNGVCTFDQSACAPGYGICSSNPDNGCDTDLSAPAHCGSCNNACPSTGTPYCSASGNAAAPFACTSGCASGLALCGESCVNEANDPNHCGGCAACPSVPNGTASCSAMVCGFTCNGNDHLCDDDAGPSCAANNDATRCGAGAACHACTAPANATPTCDGGTACGFTCNPDAHLCGGACVLDDDPNNCGTACGTNCPGPTQGNGIASCDGSGCAVTCQGGQSLCNGTACVDETSDPANCGGCGVACGSGQRCSGSRCVCDGTSCAGGCCDANGNCQPAACGTGGAACAAGCPATLAESQHLVLWLVGDAYGGGATWHDLSRSAGDATCVSCPSVVAAALNGHAVVNFDGSSFFSLADPGGRFATQNWTLVLVAAPNPSSVGSATLLAFASGADGLALARNAANQDLLFALPSGGGAGAPLVATGAWSGAWERIAAQVDVTQSGSLAIGSASPIAGTLGPPPALDYGAAFLGTDPATQTLTYEGQVAEVLVFDTTDVPSMASLQGYLSTRYAIH